MAKVARALAGLVVLLLGATPVAWAIPEPCRVMLSPGALGGDDAGSGFFVKTEEYFREHREFFGASGCIVKQAVYPMDASIAERGIVLRDQLEAFSREAPGKPIWIFGHSQGALDARYAVRSLKMSARVTAIADIGAPHQGTPAATWTMSQLEGRTWLYRFLKTVFDYDLEALRFLPELTPAFLAKHSRPLEKVPGVRYGSARGVCRSDCYLPLKVAAWWFGIPEGDGLVPGESQRFGDDLGEYDLDHLSEIGVDDAKRAERRRMLERVLEWFREEAAVSEESRSKPRR